MKLKKLASRQDKIEITIDWIASTNEGFKVN